MSLFVICAFLALVGVQSAPLDDAAVLKPSAEALAARNIIKTVDWVAVATLSTIPNITGYPFAMVKSISDGTSGNSTGVPYFYQTDLDITAKDLTFNSRCTILASFAETSYCKDNKFDPQDPRCPKLMITGRMIKVDKSSPEYEFGLQALFFKHPAMRQWPHDFYVTKLEINQVILMSGFGGVQYVPVAEYLAANSN